MVRNITENVGLNFLVVVGIAAAAMLALLSVGSHVMLDRAIEAEKTSAAEINASGRRRMYSQHIAETALALVLMKNGSRQAQLRLDLETAAREMMELHQALIQGNPVLGLPGKPSGPMQGIYFSAPYHLDQQVKRFTASARALAAAPAETLTADNPYLIDIHNAAGGPLLKAVEVVTAQYQQESEERIRQLRRLETMAMAIKLVVIVLLMLVAFWPMVRRIRREVGRLTATEVHTRTIMENMVDGLVSISNKGIVLSLNPAAEAIFGYAAGEIIGCDGDGLITEPLQLRSVGAGREVVGRRKDRSTFPMELAVSEVRSEERHEFIATVRDITERRAAELELIKKTSELERRGRHDQSYAEAMELFSSTNSAKEALSGLLTILANHHPYPVSAIYIHDEWEGVLSLAASYGAPGSIRKTFERGEGLIGQVSMETETRILEGLEDELMIEAGLLSIHPAAIIISPINHQGKTMGVMVLAASKAMDEADRLFVDRLGEQLGVALNSLKQHEDLVALSDQLKQRGEEINRQNRELLASNRMKSEFLATMSHELRTPLNAIIGFSEVLKDGVMGELNEAQVDYVSDIFNSGQHLLSLINDILDLSKIEAGRMELDLESVNVRQLLENSLSVIREKAMAQNINLGLDLNDVDSCMLDGRKLKQIVFNLLSNAVKFTPDGGSVRLSARRMKGEELEQGIGVAEPFLEGEFLEISVSDNGIGISKQDQQRLFQAFSQLDSSLSRKHEGTGLGLVMVKKLAELHGGNVRLQSEEGKGSTFTVWLPCRVEARTAAGRQPAPEAYPSEAVLLSGPDSPASAPLVLVVEDNDKAAELMRLQLEEAGYRIMRAASGQQALEMLAENRPDLITLDIIMEGMDGWELLARLKQHPDYARLPVVIVSIVADKKRGFSLGASQVLQKPIRKQALLAAIAETGVGHKAAGGRAKVLVVDDDTRAVEFVCRHLEDACELFRALGGQEGIDVARREKPDLILLDLMMPGVSGFDVVETLKLEPDTADIPIIILTAKVITEADRRVLNGDVLKIVEKSGFNHSAFIGEVRRALGRERAPAVMAGEERREPVAASEAKPPLVLIVEDNLKESDLLKVLIEGAGYRAMQAHDGAEAMMLMEQHRPTLITLDIMMSGMDGFEFLHEKGKRREFADTPVLIVSCAEEAGRGLALGANAILSKPVRKQELLDIIAGLGLRAREARKPTVLIVDDDPTSVKMISSYLQDGEFRIVRAYGGREGLEAIHAAPPDIILLDLMMPEVNGFDVIRHLQEEEETSRIPVIVLTAKLLTASERQELRKHVQVIAEKGHFNKEQFLLSVRQLLGLERRA